MSKPMDPFAHVTLENIRVLADDQKFTAEWLLTEEAARVGEPRPDEQELDPA